jgi:dipeptidyl aminopeptidase/acylaminoacyl peptidase
LTFGPGNDTEAVWSPDGRKIAFQTDRAGDLDIAVLDVAGGKVTDVIAGPGHACYPAWTPDGGLVYAFGRHTGTAVQAERAKADCGYGLRLWENGAITVLTQGYWRDYTPSVTGDGAAVYYASTQGAVDASDGVWKERVALRRLPLSPGAVSECVLPMDGDTQGAVQPSLSPDGRFLLWAGMDGFRSNWRICAARADAPSRCVFLTPGEMSAYAPRWSPDGRFIACAGFRKDDPGWGICLLDPRSGAIARLDTGTGHSRSPAWSPDGRELVFENNRTGFYKLYRMKVVLPPLAAAPPDKGAVASGEGITARFVRDVAGAELVGADGRAVKGIADGPEAFEFQRPPGLDFGEGLFFVRMTLVVRAVEKGIRIVAVGRYAEHPLGWQVIVRESGRVSFCPRDTGGGFREVASKEPLEPGKPVEVLGVRSADGIARLYLDGVLQGRCDGAGLAYGPALSVCLGRQWSGGMKLGGQVLAFECGRGWPAGVPRLATREELFQP